VAKTKIAGLKQFYRVDDARSLQFFEVHIGADEIHAEVGAGMVRTNTRDDASRAAVLGTARQCADALWGFLDGVHRAYVAA
jgi:pyrroloquinoline-quinone synthase